MTEKFHEPVLCGVDIGGTKCAVTLSVPQGNELRFLGRGAFPTPGSPHAALDRLVHTARELAQVAGCTPDAVGVSCGGPLDSRRGLVLSPPNLPGWDAIDVLTPFRQAFGVPAALCNDANACALAEWRWGAGRGSDNLVFLTFGTGMGSGLILNGRLYEGANGNAGEVGHLRLTDDGPEGYGKRGSFEGWCSGAGLARAAVEIEGFPAGITAAKLAELAHAGDERALAVYQRCARMLGRGLAALVDFFNPDCIVIGSIYARQTVLLEPEMGRVLATEALPEALACCRVVPAALGDAVGDYAAAGVALEALRSPHS